MLPKLGEIKGSLWHFRAELSVWKKKIGAMLGRINGSLDLLLDFGQDLKLSEGSKRIGLAAINTSVGPASGWGTLWGFIEVRHRSNKWGEIDFY